MYIFYLIQFYFTNVIILPFCFIFPFMFPVCFPFIYLKKKSLIDFFLLRWDKLIWHHCYKAEETGQRRHARGAIIKDLQMYALQMCRFCRFFFTWKYIKLGQKDSCFFFICQLFEKVKYSALSSFCVVKNILYCHIVLCCEFILGK